MSVETTIERKLLDALEPDYLEVVNESSGHNVPADSETHFRVTLVASAFEGHRLLGRHRQVNGILADELAGPVHALALHTYTRDEWEKRFGEVPESPACLGGGDGSAVAKAGAYGEQGLG
jgi:BolA protein